MSARDTIDTVVRERGAALYRYAFVLTGDRSQAEDLVQDALVRVFSSLGRPLPLNAAHVYVKRAITTAFIDGDRRRSARPVVADAAEPEAPTPDPADDVATALAIHAAVLTLPRRERACVVLRYLEDMSTAAVAEELGLAQGSVKRYLADGLARLRSEHPGLAFDESLTAPVHPHPRKER